MRRAALVLVRNYCLSVIFYQGRVGRLLRYLDWRLSWELSQVEGAEGVSEKSMYNVKTESTGKEISQETWSRSSFQDDE